jgi:hypothetical protein
MFTIRGSREAYMKEVSQALYQVTWDKIDAVLRKFYLEKQILEAMQQLLQQSEPWCVSGLVLAALFPQN